MKYKTISMGLKRDCRHARFNISQCSIQMSVELEEGDDLQAAYRELHEDCDIIVEEMVKYEKEKYRESLHETDSKPA